MRSRTRCRVGKERADRREGRGNGKWHKTQEGRAALELAGIDAATFPPGFLLYGGGMGGGGGRMGGGGQKPTPPAPDTPPGSTANDDGGGDGDDDESLPIVTTFTLLVPPSYRSVKLSFTLSKAVLKASPCPSLAELPMFIDCLAIV